MERTTAVTLTTHFSIMCAMRAQPLKLTCQAVPAASRHGEWLAVVGVQRRQMALQQHAVLLPSHLIVLSEVWPHPLQHVNNVLPDLICGLQAALDGGKGR